MCHLRPFFVPLLLICLTSQFLLATETDTLNYSVFMGSREAGTQQSWINKSGENVYSYTFNDRGRGPSLTEVIALTEDEQLQSITITGHDYTKNQVHEKFQAKGKIARWSSASDSGQDVFKNQYYYPINGTIGGKEILIKLLNSSPDESLNLLPYGTIQISIKKSLKVADKELTLYGINGVSYGPSFYWIDGDQKLFAVVSSSRGITCIRSGYEELKDTLVSLQVAHEDEYYHSIADKTTDIPNGIVAITNVSIFNSITGIVDSNQTLVFEGNKIVKIGAAHSIQLSGTERIINGAGKTLLPGFFDMHVHVGKDDGILHIAGGVTSVRDMAVQTNYITDKKELREDFESNKKIGPRIVGMCGFIDGNGPFTRDKGIDDVDQGLAWIDEFNSAGIKQIKLYSSIKPEWVKPLAERAHSYNMVVSGHIPAFMTATQAIEEGYDEIQHTNMLFLNFYGDTLDTRNMTRFSAVGEQAHSFDFESTAFTDFVDLLKKEDIIIDPTMAIFEWGFKSVTGEASPTYKDIVHRLPLSNRRQYYTGGFARPPGMHQKYLQSYSRMMDMIKELHKRGVRIVPGTDNLAGFAYHRELELYVAAGITSSEVLQLATIESAKIAGRADQLGSLEIGKLADMVLISGNPIEDISTVRNTVLTIKNGLIYHPENLYSAVGVSSN